MVSNTQGKMQRAVSAEVTASASEVRDRVRAAIGTVIEWGVGDTCIVGTSGARRGEQVR